jgi:hypothetical protein
MNFKNFRPWAALLIIPCFTLLAGCRVKYTFSGASIDPAAQTFSVAYFPNNASMVAPSLSSTFTDALKERMSRQTRLVEDTEETGDLAFDGEIVGYTSTPAAITGNEVAEQNRLTIRVRVRFTNAIDPKLDFNRTFQQFADYSTSTPLEQAEGSLIPEIVDMLVDDIFNAATSNW